MRLDAFLKKTAIIKRRVVAKDIIERGNAYINNKLAKPSSEVKNGDKITLHLGGINRSFLAIIETKKDKEFPSYEYLNEA